MKIVVGYFSTYNIESKRKNDSTVEGHMIPDTIFKIKKIAAKIYTKTENKII